MELSFLKGSKKEFLEFVSFITTRDKIAIVSDSDLDGIASALFLEKFLNSKNLDISYFRFERLNAEALGRLSYEMNQRDITKVFFCDMSIEAIDFFGYNELKKNMDVFIIDHHPLDMRAREMSNIIKNISADCTALIIYEMTKEFYDSASWEWLLIATMFSEFSYKSSKHFEYMKKVYPTINLENLSSSIPGINARKMSSALIYYKDNPRIVFDIVKERKLEDLEEIHEIIEEEVTRIVEDFTEKKKFYKTKNLYFYEINSKFELLSYVTSLVSKSSPDETFVFMQRKDEFIKFSARNQNTTKDMGELMKICTEGLTRAQGGGHAPAAGARILSGDLTEFKRRLTKNC